MWRSTTTNQNIIMFRFLSVRVLIHASDQTKHHCLPCTHILSLTVRVLGTTCDPFCLDMLTGTDDCRDQHIFIKFQAQLLFMAPLRLKCTPAHTWTTCTKARGITIRIKMTHKHATVCKHALHVMHLGRALGSTVRYALNPLACCLPSSFNCASASTPPSGWSLSLGRLLAAVKFCLISH